jgi:hypothetical protein
VARVHSYNDEGLIAVPTRPDREKRISKNSAESE